MIEKHVSIIFWECIEKDWFWSGMTIPYVLLDLGHMMAGEAGLAYVALTRVRELRNLFVGRLHPGVIAANANAIREINRIRRLHSLPISDQFNATSETHPNARKLVNRHLPRTEELELLENVIDTPDILQAKANFKKPSIPLIPSKKQGRRVQPQQLEPAVTHPDGLRERGVVRRRKDSSSSGSSSARRQLQFPQPCFEKIP